MSGAGSQTSQNAPAEAERERILAEYRRRAQEVESDLWAPWQPAAMFMRQGRMRIAASLLKRSGVFPRPGDACLEVGFGSSGWLAELLAWGVRETDLHGIELQPGRVARARETFPAADLRVGDATQLAYPSEHFHLAIASTLFTSILSPEVRRMVAGEITRVLRPGAALLWYDFKVDNPRNPNVRKVTERELRELFPALKGTAQSATLLPPLARILAPRSWALATLFESLPFLRTHLVAVLLKGV